MEVQFPMSRRAGTSRVVNENNAQDPIVSHGSVSACQQWYGSADFEIHSAISISRIPGGDSPGSGVLEADDLASKIQQP
jgi:hypothetical protein